MCRCVLLETLKSKHRRRKNKHSKFHLLSAWFVQAEHLYGTSRGKITTETQRDIEIAERNFQMSADASSIYDKLPRGSNVGRL